MPTVTAIANRLDFEIHQGASALWTITLTDAEGEAFDLTDYDIRYEADTVPPLIKDIDTGGIICDNPTTGVFVIEFEPEDTASLPIAGIRAYRHECRIERDDMQYVVFFGTLTIREALFTELDDAS